MLRLITFDLDGTLVDTAGEIAESVHRAFDDAGLARRPLDEITRLIGRGAHALMHRLLERVMAERPGLAGGLDTGHVLERFEHHYGELAGCIARPYPGCEATLERLRAHGVQLACVTNKEQRHAERVLRATGLEGWFPLLIGGDTLPVKKPDAAVMAHVLRHFGVTAAQTAHVGDSAIDVQTARAAGVLAWAVPHGYNAGVPIADAGPDHLFADLPAIADRVCSTTAALAS